MAKPNDARLAVLGSPLDSVRMVHRIGRTSRRRTAAQTSRYPGTGHAPGRSSLSP